MLKLPLTSLVPDALVCCGFTTKSRRRSDPGERYMEGIRYNDWWYRRTFCAIPVQHIVGEFLVSFQQFPPRQKPGSFTVSDAVEALSQTAHGSN